MFLGIFVLFWSLAISSAFGQGAIQQSGPVTPGHLGSFGANGAVVDSGTGILLGATGSIGGSALSAGTCASGTATVTNAAPGMVVAVSPASNPLAIFIQGLAIWGYVSAASTVTVEVCAIIDTTPTAAIYNVRVIE